MTTAEDGSALLESSPERAPEAELFVASGGDRVDGSRHLRADAQRNKALILAAAREVFARRGLDATLDEVAREAGLGVGTVYRRFRDKSELAEALFEEDLERLIADAELALENPDPWEGFVTFLRRFLERQAADCGLRDLLSSTTLDHARFAALKARLRPVVENVVQRAQGAGALRADFDGYDIAPIAVMLGSVVDFTRDVRPELWRRYLSIILDGLRARTGASSPGKGSGGLAEPALDDDDLAAAMSCWRPRHR